MARTPMNMDQDMVRAPEPSPVEAIVDLEDRMKLTLFLRHKVNLMNHSPKELHRGMRINA